MKRKSCERDETHAPPRPDLRHRSVNQWAPCNPAVPPAAAPDAPWVQSHSKICSFLLPGEQSDAHQMHTWEQQGFAKRSLSRGAFMPTPQSDAGSAGIARARRRGLLAKFGGRGGVRAAAACSNAISRHA